MKISELREALESVTSEQKYLRARDARHRHSKTLFLSLNKDFMLSYRNGYKWNGFPFYYNAEHHLFG